MRSYANFEQFLETFMLDNAPGIIWISDGRLPWIETAIDFKSTTAVVWQDTPNPCGLTLTEIELQNKMQTMNDAGQIPVFIAQVRGL